jgi:hypothetical protein
MNKLKKATKINMLKELAENDKLIEVGRLAIEDELVKWRDDRLSVFCGNGFSIREFDGTPSTIIRFGTEHGLKIALTAIIQHLEKEGEKQ